jgi:hypothetical protein
MKPSLRGGETDEAIQSFLWALDCFAALAMTPRGNEP